MESQVQAEKMHNTSGIVILGERLCRGILLGCISSLSSISDSLTQHLRGFTSVADFLPFLISAKQGACRLPGSVRCGCGGCAGSQSVSRPGGVPWGENGHPRPHPHGHPEDKGVPGRAEGHTPSGPQAGRIQWPLELTLILEHHNWQSGMRFIQGGHEVVILIAARRTGG